MSECFKNFLKLYSVFFVISTLYAVLTFDDLHHIVTKTREKEDVVSKVFLSKDNVYLVGQSAIYMLGRQYDQYNELPFTLSEHVISLYLNDATIIKSLNGAVWYGGFAAAIINPKKLTPSQKLFLDERIKMDTSGMFMLDGELFSLAKRQDPTWSEKDEAYVIKGIHFDHGRLLPLSENIEANISFETSTSLILKEEYQEEEFNQNAVDEFVKKATAPFWIPIAVVTLPIWIQAIPGG